MLESCDNPILSFSSKLNKVSFKALQTEENERQKYEELTIHTNDHTASSSLAEMFMNKKQNIMSRINEREVGKTNTKLPKAQKTKEELIEIRKQMMKRNRSGSPRSLIEKSIQPNEVKHANDKSVNDSNTNHEHESTNANSKLKDPPLEVLQRLTSGKKQKIEEKEMKRLTSKNYEKLPEVVKSKEIQKKKEELKARVNRAKEYDKKRKCQAK